MTMSDAESRNGTERPAPEDDPFVCSRCGVAIGGAKRIRGDEYCDDCQHDTEEYVRCETCGDRLPRSRARALT